MTTNKRATGDFNEAVAEHELLKLGITIIEKNYHARVAGGKSRGEIDLIGIDSRLPNAASTLVFIEVKSCKSLDASSLEYSISQTKQNKIIGAAKHFICNNQQYRNMRIRFDVVFIGEDGFRHFPSAFEG